MTRSSPHCCDCSSVSATVRLCVAAIGLMVCFSVRTMAQDVVPSTDRQQLLLIVGASGLDEYKPLFEAWAQRWLSAGERGGVRTQSIGLSPIEVPATEHAEADSTTTAPPAALSDKDRLRNCLADATSLEGTEPLWIVFIGHATFDSKSARLNLQGPDVSAEELADWLKSAKRPVAIIVCASSSSPFINALSGPGRVVISATKDGNQIQFSRFGDHLSVAISGVDADTDRDGQTSLLEAWLFASRRTAEFYETEGRLATEHSLLDDNGDAKGSRAELFDGGRPAANLEKPDEVDGGVAARWHFLRTPDEQRLTSDQRTLRDALELRISLLKQRREQLEESDYLQQLQELLLPLAQLYETTASAQPPTPVEATPPVKPTTLPEATPPPASGDDAVNCS